MDRLEPRLAASRVAGEAASRARPGDLPTDAWCRSGDDVLRQVGCARAAGLGASEAAARLATHGANELTERAGRSRLAIVREQLLNVMTFILLAAAVLSVALGDWIEAVAGRRPGSREREPQGPGIGAHGRIGGCGE